MLCVCIHMLVLQAMCILPCIHQIIWLDHFCHVHLPTIDTMYYMFVPLQAVHLYTSNVMCTKFVFLKINVSKRIVK